MADKFVVKNADDYIEDEAKVKNGVRLNFGDGRYITVTRAGPGNRKYKAKLAQVLEEHSKAGGMRGLDMEDEEATKMFHQLYAETIVLGWGGWIGGDDKEIKFSRANVIGLFESVPEVFRLVRNEAEELQNFTHSSRENLGNGLQST